MKLAFPLAALALAAALSLLAPSGPAAAFAPSPPPLTPGSLSQYAPGVPSSLLDAAESSPLEGAESAGLAQAGSTDFAPPAALAGSVAKSIAGGTAVVLLAQAWGDRANIAQGTLQVFGVSAEGAVCAPGNDTGNWSGIVQGITGDDCASATTLNPAYVANGDQSSVTSGGPSCAVISGGGTACVSLAYIGTLVYGTTTYYRECFSASYTGVTGSPYYGVVINPGTGGGAGSLSVQAGSTDGSGVCTASPAAFSIAGNNTVSSYCANADGGFDCAGEVSPVSTSSGDPVRTLKCVVATSSGGVYDASTAGFQESSGVLPTPVCPDLPAGSVTTDTKIFEVTPGQPDELLEDLPSTTAYGNWAAEHPSCTGGGCALDVQTQSVPRQSCNENPAAVYNGVSCADWFTDPNRSADFVCTYDGSDLDISECNVLSQFYKPASLTNGDLYADPLTGSPVGGSSSTLPGTIAPGTPVQNPEQSRSCFPTGWGVFNPVGWVMQPVICAAQYLFVPRESALKSDGSKVRSLINASAVGSVIGILVGMGTFPITGDGCGGIEWRFQIAGLDEDIHLLAACPGDTLAPTASAVKGLLTAVVIIAGVLTSIRYIANIFGYIGFGGIVDSERRQEYRDTARERRSGGRFS